MKRIFFIISVFIISNSQYLNAFAGGPILPKTGQTISFVASDDGDIQTGVSWPEPRFVDNNNGTMTDNLTGLLWLKNASCFYSTWTNAIATARSLADGQCGLSDGSLAGQWRVPNVLEYRSLMDVQQQNNGLWLESQGFSNVVQGYYWTSNAPSGGSYVPAALTVTSLYGDVVLYNTGGSNPFWPVRNALTAGSVQLPKTSQTVSFIAGDDGDLQSGKPWPEPRFVDNNDETITDMLTNLIWTKDANAPGPTACVPATTKTWEGAFDYVSCINDNKYLGKTDWRLPNINELMSTATFGLSRRLPLIEDEGFYNLKGYYWSSNTYSRDSTSALSWCGPAICKEYKSVAKYVWPVRGGVYSLDSLNIYGELYLGRHNVGSAKLQKVLTIQNGGAFPQSVTSVMLTGADYEQFDITPGGASPCISLTPTLAANEKCNLSLSFTPTSIGVKKANITIESNSKTLDVPISGTGIATILGTVYNLGTGYTLAGATITLNGGKSTTSDVAGNFIFDPDLPLGTYSVTVSKTGYSGYSIYNATTTSTSGAVVNFYIAPSGSLNFTSAASLIGAESGTAYSNHLKITGGVGPYSFSIVPGFGDLPPGISLDSVSGLISGTPTISGNYTFWVSCIDAVTTATEKEFTINVSSPLTINSSSLLLNGTKDFAYTYNVTVTGGNAPFNFTKTAGNLPTGLTLSSSGVISGTPTVVGQYTFTITVTDAYARTVFKSFSITIDPALVISTSGLNDGIVGAPYSLTLSSTGNIGATGWSLVSGTLPTGLLLDGVTGIISGIPSAVQIQTITISVQDSAGRVTNKQFTIKIGNQLFITTSTLPTGYLTIPYTATIQSNGGIAPIVYSVTSGILPTGLTLNSATGTISGTPTTGGVLANLIVTATDSSYPTKQTSQMALSIRILSTLPQYTFTLSLSGESPGSVTGNINCSIGSSCQPVQFNLGTTITLTAVPDPTSIFTGWSGACSGTSTICTVYMDAAKNVSASFIVRPKYNLTLSFSGDGNGQVNGDVACTSGSTCPTKLFLLGVTATLMPTPDTNSLFGGWSGACDGFGNCSLFMDAAKSVTATFTTGKSVKVMQSQKTYNLLQDAYNDGATVSGYTIMGRAVALKENLVLDKMISVTIRGGYDTAFLINNDETAVQGSIMVKYGSLVVDRLVIW